MQEFAMNQKKHLLYLVDASGVIEGVQLSPELWRLVEKTVKARAAELNGEDNPLNRPEAMDSFKEFMDAWDFRYPYDPSVTCPQCGAHADDWQRDPRHPFHLKNANLGGLLVFHCKQCGATVRKKHFRDHVATECTPAR